jgi:protein associated with RNAse G/E
LGILIEARFNRTDLPFHGITLRKNDRYEELYLLNKWFNIFAIHDIDTDELKAWYCNVTRPPIINSNLIAYDDLALDLLVFPDDRQLTLDEDEFEKLDLSPEEKKSAQKGLSELELIFKNPAQFRFETLLRQG